MLAIPGTVGQECLCTAKFVGEYCGNELNVGSEASNCSQDLIYFCGKSNMRKTAYELRACTEGKGYPCNTKENKDNPCFQNLRCNCGDNNSRRKKYCGSDLVGPGCKPNIVYKCPMFRSSKLQVEDACPNGCKDGKCIR
ncbi:unnamed protein product [Medioppia subpectinata]|uniref:Uncharacterized protein n=1 Tax=Medioppia subpectinata TaxID=1979941 RepID=A0A7R9Q6J1_9ACAR|nr:unnamed protein product [Medioppia subpectinata]CAG2114604.1 unnamed protein product [Medioppia subpectinata]